MSVNSTATFLRQKLGLMPMDCSRQFYEGYLQCIKDFEEFGD